MPDGTPSGDDKIEKPSHGESFWPWYLRNQAAERRAKELAKLGEDGYAARHAAIAAAAAMLMERVEPLVDEARKLDFLYFRCELAYRDSEGIHLEFADGKGRFFERRIGLEKLMKSKISFPRISEYWDVVDAVHHAVRGHHGFKMLTSRMKQERVLLATRTRRDAGAREQQRKSGKHEAALGTTSTGHVPGTSALPR